MLQTLVLGNNHIEGTFPFLLGALPNLQVLILRSNKFHGVIENPEINLAFPKLRIIDLSHNSFSGTFPSEFFKNWNAMKMVEPRKLTYMQVYGNYGTSHGTFVCVGNYSYSMKIAHKGTEKVYEKIQSSFVAIDLSDNKFSGEIPESLGSLNGLQVLNISDNNLTRAIPSSLANSISQAVYLKGDNSICSKTVHMMGIPGCVVSLYRHHVKIPRPHHHRYTALKRMKLSFQEVFTGW
ncbi:hypothetical protein RHGRI_009768 [Rhododendron griersonianum]|uniref:Uncharacterized protein n=1 Tax=Rhododendron griersonianum TaxID=479676 RepID=A0AAV6KG16_9ERIC|nr:hypothetical protein RHGRI_009768 [Rhododendron griersonianum]